MTPERLVTYAAVSDLYQQQCGEVGVLEFLRDSFAKSVIANGGYSPVLEKVLPLSTRQVKSIGLTRHRQATWYRLDGTVFPGTLVGVREVNRCA